MPENTVDTLQRNEYSHYYNLSWSYRNRSSEFNAWVEELMAEASIGSSRPTSIAKVRWAFKVILLNLYYVYKKDPTLYTSYSRGASNYSQWKLFIHDYISYDITVAVVNFLIEKGLVEHHIGYQNHSTGHSDRSKMRAKEELISILEPMLASNKMEYAQDQKPVRLKNSEGELMEPYSEQLSVYEQLVESTKKINDFLSQQSIGLCMLDADYPKLTRPVDTERKALYRVFNHSSLEKGGRFYGGWWQQVPSNFRKHIAINSKPIIEVDYRAIHLHMLYSLEQTTPPFDDDTDPYEMCYEYLDESFFSECRASNKDPRRVVKDGINMLVNMSACDADRIHPLTMLVRDASIQAHPILENYFCTGKGVELQCIDSMIAEAIMHKLIDSGVTPLPIHDSFVVNVEHKQDLIDAMRDTYKEMLDVTIAPEKKFDISISESDTLPITDDNKESYTIYLSQVDG